MDRLKCKGCGANLDFDGTRHIIKCPYCGTVYKDPAKNQSVKEHMANTFSGPTVTIERYGDASERPRPRAGLVILFLICGMPILIGYLVYIGVKQKAWDDSHR